MRLCEKDYMMKSTRCGYTVHEYIMLRRSCLISTLSNRLMEICGPNPPFSRKTKGKNGAFGQPLVFGQTPYTRAAPRTSDTCSVGQHSHFDGNHAGGFAIPCHQRSRDSNSKGEPSHPLGGDSKSKSKSRYPMDFFLTLSH